MKARWQKLVIGIVCASCVAGPLAWADDGTSEPMVSAWSPFVKLGRGVSNIVFGWLEIPETMEDYRQTHDAGTAFFAGAAVGTVKGIGRMGIGAYETLTFLFPIPEHYAPILPPIRYFRKE